MRQFTTGKLVQQQQESIIVNKNNIIDFHDTRALFQKLSTSELMTSLIVLSSCRNPLVRNYGPSFLELGGPVAKPIAKYTYFSYFCGGEELSETSAVIDRLYNRNLWTILDYCVEGSPLGDTTAPISVHVSEQREDDIAQVKFNSISFMGKENERLLKQQGHKASSLPCPLGVVKMTGISDCNLLLRVSEILVYINLFPNSPYTQAMLNTQFEIFNQNNEGYNLDFASIMKEYARTTQRTRAFNMEEKNPPEMLNTDQLAKWRRVIDRLERICQECQNTGVGLLIDAEQTYLQPAIDLLSMFVTLKYNGNVKKGYRPIVHNTYQLYLKDTVDRLKFDHAFIKKHGDNKIKQGVKLVRGAYIKSETERCRQLGLPHPFNENIQETHKSYHRGVDYVLNHMAKEDSIAAVIASHNADSIVYAGKRLAELDLKNSDCRVMFAQLYGMGDSLSLALSNHGFNISKLVPFGPVEEVLPYLSRRLVENSDILGGSAVETKRLRQEIINRLFGSKK